jgi:glucokinase
MPDQDAIISTLAKDLEMMGGEAGNRHLEIKGVGFGIAGRILSQEGRIAFSPNIPALNDCPLAEHLQPKLSYPVFLENDANLFTLGEYWLGAGSGYNNLLGITLGTGVGGGLILDGRLWQGAQGTTGEIGHITVEPDGQKCHCGNHGCLETLASASWTVAWVKEQLAQKAPSWLKDLYATDPDAIRGETLVAAALNRDPLAIRAFERVGRSLGQAIADVVHLLGLSRVIIGGGFSGAWEVFQPAMSEEIFRRLTLFPPEEVSVSPAKLGNDAGLLGAARLAWDMVSSKQ